MDGLDDLLEILPGWREDSLDLEEADSTDPEQIIVGADASLGDVVV